MYTAGRFYWFMLCPWSCVLLWLQRCAFRSFWIILQVSRLKVAKFWSQRCIQLVLWCCLLFGGVLFCERRYQSLSENIRAYLNLSEPIWAYQSLSEHIRAYQRLSEPVWAHQSLSETIRAYQSLPEPCGNSKTVRRRTTGSTTKPIEYIVVTRTWKLSTLIVEGLSKSYATYDTVATIELKMKDTAEISKIDLTYTKQQARL